MNPAHALRREARRAELLDAAIQVIRREGPAASMDQIAAEAGITKPIVYRYFGDRAGLYRAVAERYCAEMRARFQADRRSSPLRLLLRDALDRYFALVERDPNVYRFLIEPQHAAHPASRTAVSTFTYQVGEELAEAFREGMELSGLDTRAAEPWGHAIAGMVQAAGVWWMTDPHLTRGELVEHLTALAWNGLASVAGPFDEARERSQGEATLKSQGTTG